MRRIALCLVMVGLLSGCRHAVVPPHAHDTLEAAYVREHHCVSSWRRESYTHVNMSTGKAELASGLDLYRCPGIDAPLLVSDDEFEGGKP
jgi:hypothetical protein